MSHFKLIKFLHFNLIRLDPSGPPCHLVIFTVPGHTCVPEKQHSDFSLPQEISQIYYLMLPWIAGLNSSTANQWRWLLIHLKQHSGTITYGRRMCAVEKGATLELALHSLTPAIQLSDLSLIGSKTSSPQQPDATLRTPGAAEGKVEM